MPVIPNLARLMFLGLLLAGCGRDPGPNPALHDSKFAAIGQLGEPIGTDAGPWPCVLDQYTGLMWEGKDDAPGLHDWRNNYSWHDPTEAHDQGLDYRGVADGGKCAGSVCDTEAFVAAVNAAGRCGHRDWRLPTREELASISDPRKISTPPTINTELFLFMQPAEYWSANDYSFQWDAAWAWSFQFGHDRVDWKRVPKSVRLVRGEAAKLAKVKG